jgi:serine/threonine protein kinase
VQLGINKETGQEVAIKTIKKSKIETEADLIRIRREVQIMSSVQHPNIIHIYEGKFISSKFSLYLFVIKRSFFCLRTSLKSNEKLLQYFLLTISRPSKEL